jgi:hypothetical protein
MILEQVDDGEDTKWDGARDGRWGEGSGWVGVEIRDARAVVLLQGKATHTRHPSAKTFSVINDSMIAVVRRYLVTCSGTVRLTLRFVHHVPLFNLAMQLVGTAVKSEAPRSKAHEAGSLDLVQHCLGIQSPL